MSENIRVTSAAELNMKTLIRRPGAVFALLRVSGKN